MIYFELIKGLKEVFKTKASKEINSQLKNIVREISMKRKDNKEVPKVILDKIDVVPKKSIKKPKFNRKVLIEVERDEVLYRM